MPHSPYASNAFDGFVTLSQLTASPIAIADQDSLLDTDAPTKLSGVSWPSLGHYSTQQMSLLSGSFSDMPQQTPDVPDLTSPFNTSSASNSPSPREGFFSVQQEQHQKRRAQNRAAQRAYRDRKMRHLVDLESGIRDVEEQIRRLQTENTGLIRELCEIRAENREWKEGRTRSNISQRSRSGDAGLNSSQPNTGPRHDGFKKRTHTDQRSEEDTLTAPFEAMWNLICLDPAVANGDISAETVLERLRGKLGAQSDSESGKRLMSSLSAIQQCSPKKDPPRAAT